MSEYTDFYMSWLGCAAFGNGTTTQLITPIPVVFKPTDISDCSVWLDGTDNVSITADGSNNVLSWANKGDLSGAFVDISGQATPLTNTHDISGNNVVWFDSYQSLAANLTFPTEAFTLFGVGTVLSDLTVNNYASFFLGLNSYDFGQNIFWDSGSSLYYNGIAANGIDITVLTTTVSDPQNVTAIYAYRASSDLSSNEILINGTSQTLAFNQHVGYNTSASDYYLHYYGHSSSLDMGELIIYNRALTNIEVTEVLTYLSGKWGIPLV